MGKFYVLLMYACLSIGVVFGQQVITGTVSNAEGGDPLANVSVAVAGAGVVAQTDDGGSYRITVPAGSEELIFSMIGYQTLRQPINGRTVIHVQLVPTAQDLDEVVVVGYGTQKKINLTGSVETISGDVLADRPVISTSMGLQGLLPGVTVTQSSGRPGADGGTIRIRGIGTLGNANPLVLVDGREGSMESVDANDIESVSILKDASAAAIYGSRAANGVILVTTKRAKAGILKVDYHAYAGRQYFTDLPEYVDGYTHLIKNNEAVANSGRTPIYSEDYISRYKDNNGLYSYEYPNVDWQDVMYSENGYQEHHNLSISGGNERLTSLVSLSYRNQDGLLNNYKAQRIGVRANTDMKISEKIDFSFDLNARISPISFPASGADFVFDLVRYDPLFAVYLPDGRYSTNDRNYPNLKAMVMEGGYNKTDYAGLSGRLMAKVKPVDGLELILSYMPEYGQSRGTRFSKPVGVYSPGDTEPSIFNPSMSSLTETFSRDFTNNVNAIATYSKQLLKHDVSILLGYEQIDFRTNNINAYRENFTFLDYPVLNTGSLINMSNGGTGSEWALQSFFGRVNYNFDNKYLFEANARYDGSSRFHASNRFGFFPSFSAGWVLSQEDFLKDHSVVSELKIRASWGKLGNQQIGTYPYASVVNLGQNYVLGGSALSGGALTEMANERITWESTTSTNIGVDFGLWYKFSGSFEYYQRDTYDILLRLPIPRTIGLTAPYQNAGQVRNTGWDLSLAYRNFDKPFGYSVRAVLSDVHNKVIDLKGAGPFISTYTIIKEGEPIDALFMYQSDGLFQTTQEIESHAAQFGALAPGDIRYVDQLTIDSNGDGIMDEADGLINADDRVVVGSNIPRYSFSLDLNARYKGFDVSLFLQGVAKRDAYYGGSMAWAFYNRSQLHTWQLDHWSPENPNASYPRLIDGSSHNNFQISDYWKYDASYLRLKTFQLGYTLPAQWTQKAKIERLRVYCSGNNLLTVDKLPKGFDPEYPMGHTPIYPITGNYVFGINLTF